MAGFTLEGRVALVTGAGIRLGRAIALRLAQAGADVAVHHRTSGKDAGEVAEAIRGLGRRAVTLQADIEDPAACEELVEKTIAALGGLDLLVHS
ncbi:MAG TPA: SDR family NAD(P)-dependent oxidoreductase, partial [Thermoanaerobaculia bacterium]